MKFILFVLSIIILSSCVFSQIKPIEDIKLEDTTPIENVNIDTPNIDEKSFENIPLDTNYASKEEYNKELEEIIKKYDIKEKQIDPFYNKNDIYRPPVGERYLISDKIEILKAGVSIKGRFEATQDYYYLEGENFNWVNGTSGTAENILLTTCSDHKRPHLSIYAKKLSFIQKPGQITFVFRNVGIKIYNANIMWLPVYHLTISKNNYPRYFAIPFITYNSNDGFGFRMHPRLFQSGRFYLDPLIRWSFKNNWRYDIYANFALDKDFGNNPFITDIGMDKSIQNLNNFARYSPYKNGFAADNYKNRAHLTGSIGTVWKDNETFIAEDPHQDVDVYKTIEVNLKYSFDPFGDIKKFNLYSLYTPFVRVSYAREKDTPSIHSYINKYKFNTTIPFALANYKGINIQPLVKYDYVKYTGYGTYKVYSLGIDISKYYEDSSFWNIKYIGTKDAGRPILESDNMNQERGLFLSGQKTIKNKYVAGAWFGYNDKINTIQRAGLMVGIKEDCFWLSLGYDIARRKTYVSCALLGF